MTRPTDRSPTTDLTAADVAWDLEPLVDGRGAEGVDALLDDAEARARTRWRRTAGRIAELDAAGSPSSCTSSPTISELVGRAGSYAGLRFAVDTADPDDRRAHGSASRSAAPRSATSCSSSSSSGPTVPDERADALLADDRARVLPRTTCARPAATGRTCSASPRSDPRREVVTGAQRVGRACSTSSRRRSPSTSTATTVGARAGPVAARCRPTATCAAPRPRRSPPGSSRGCARARSCSTRCSPTSRPTTGCVSYPSAGSRAATSPTRRATSRCRRSSTRSQARYDIPQRWYALKAQLLGLDQLADYDRMASVATLDEEFGWDEATRARARRVRVVLARARRRRRSGSSTSRGSTRRCGRASGPGAFCAYTVPSHHPYLLLNWTVAPARRAHARARARPRPARVPRARAGRLPPDHAAHAGRDRVGVRRDGHVRPPARRDRRSRRHGSRCWPRASRARSRPCSARSR